MPMSEEPIHADQGMELLLRAMQHEWDLEAQLRDIQVGWKAFIDWIVPRCVPGAIDEAVARLRALDQE